MEIITFLIRWSHLLFGIAWVGLLFYFNFVQSEYVKEADTAGLHDVKAKLLPRALGWFRWSAMLTFISGFILLVGLGHTHLLNDYIVLGAVLGIVMFINVWLIIWPQQQIVLGLKAGDIATAGAKVALASRTNVLFSAPMLFCMLASPHLGYTPDYLVLAEGAGLGLWLSLALVLLLELNALLGKQGPMASIRGVIHMSLALTALFFLINLYL